MNWVLIIFLLVVIIIAFYLASIFFALDYLIQNASQLNPNTPSSSAKDPTSVSSSPISAGALDGPASSRYFYEGWFYINTNIPVTQENVLFRRGLNFVVTLKGSTLNIWAPTSNSGCNVTDNGVFTLGTTDTSNNKLASIPNFPYQKWAQLVINVDGNRVDIYVDGLFVQSVQSNSAIGSTGSDPIHYGNKYIDGKVARFRRPATNINPQGVWQSYNKGSGQGESVSDHHLNIGVTKNQTTRYNVRLY